MTSIIIVDYGVGNIGSVVNMFKKIGVQAKLSSDVEEIKAANKLFLPGVGSFDHGMSGLEKSGLVEVLQHKVMVDKTPILGVCLGMQLLFEGSEEGQRKGLGWIEGTVKRFDFGKNVEGLKTPHMGWNFTEVENESKLFAGFAEEQRFYFVHSYHVVCSKKENILATTSYGYDFTSAVTNGNIMGVQFHPEKSHKFGMQLLKNFVEGF